MTSHNVGKEFHVILVRMAEHDMIDFRDVRMYCGKKGCCAIARSDCLIVIAAGVVQEAEIGTAHKDGKAGSNIDGI
jgi:hypothetical protein